MRVVFRLRDGTQFLVESEVVPRVGDMVTLRYGRPLTAQEHDDWTQSVYRVAEVDWTLTVLPEDESGVLDPVRVVLA